MNKNKTTTLTCISSVFQQYRRTEYGDSVPVRYRIGEDRHLGLLLFRWYEQRQME